MNTAREPEPAERWRLQMITSSGLPADANNLDHSKVASGPNGGAIEVAWGRKPEAQVARLNRAAGRHTGARCIQIAALQYAASREPRTTRDRLIEGRRSEEHAVGEQEEVCAAWIPPDGERLRTAVGNPNLAGR